MNIEKLKQKIVATLADTKDESLLQNVLNILSNQSSGVEDNDLTKLCMGASEKSLAEAWDNEDDERWNAFLKN